MPVRTFRIPGNVVDARTNKAGADLRVEAWDRDVAEHILFGSGVTDARGNFVVNAAVDLQAGVLKPVPVFLKVFDKSKQLDATGDTSIPDLIKFDTKVSLSVTRAAQEKEETDKISLDQLLSGIDFIRLSDFRGVFQEGRDRTGATAKVVFDAARSGVGKIELKPLRPSEVRNRDIVNQDTATATQRLGQRSVRVTAVKPYKRGTESLNTITSMARNVKPGDNVELFEEDGVVRSYRVVKQPGTDNVDVKRLDDQVKLLQGQVAERDKRIESLQTELTGVKRAHEDLAGRMKPERLAAMEESIRKLQDRIR